MVSEDEKAQIKYDKWIMPYIEQLMQLRFGKQYEEITVSWGVPKWYMNEEKQKYLNENVCFVHMTKGLDKVTMVHKISRNIIIEASVDAREIYDEYDNFPELRKLEEEYDNEICESK
jgi:hypothetical protein